jgi:putative hydrolase of the HAD superfamily
VTIKKNAALELAKKNLISPFLIGIQVYQSSILEYAEAVIMNIMPEKREPQTLLIDCDDTLWENNVYFERAIAKFISFLDHREHSPEQVRLILNEVERDSVIKHGYGLHSFTHSLVACFRKLSIATVTPEMDGRIRSFAHQIADHPIELIAGVTETLEYLGQRHRLIMMTKGNSDEQSGKVERSGLKKYFSEVEIVAEKNEETYRSAIVKQSLPADKTWMIGNSPKSDVNPALAAGLHAVFIAHDNTWILEHEEVATATSPQRLLVLQSFADLAKHF